MEEDKTANVSDRDRRMQGSFESYGDKPEKSEKKKKKRGESEPIIAERQEDSRRAEREHRQDDSKEKKADIPDDESIAPGEKPTVNSMILEFRAEEAKEDLDISADNSPQEQEAAAALALLEEYQELVEQGESLDDETLDKGFETVVQELGLEQEPAEPDGEEEAEAEAGEVPETVPETEEPEENDPSTPVPPSPPAGGGGTLPGGNPPSPPTPPVPPVGPPGGGLPPSQPPLGPPGPGNPGGGNMPPFGPPNPNFGPGPNVGFNPNTAPAPVAAPMESWRPNRRRAGELLLVGVVGYLIGRRRGRIKTEARLLPIQEKLEKEVQTLHDKVAEREAKIRRLAAEQAEKAVAQSEAPAPVIMERLQARQERKAAERQAAEVRPVDAMTSEKVAAAGEIPAAEDAVENSELPVEPAALEQEPTPAPVHRPEALGRFALPETEIKATPVVERVPAYSETMPQEELLAVANKIEKDGISVKEMYETGRLDAVGLRRVVREYLGGRRFEEVLQENLRPMEHYEQLERDPLQRDQQRPADLPGAGDGGSGSGGGLPLPFGAGPATPADAGRSDPTLSQDVQYVPPPASRNRTIPKTMIAAGLGIALLLIIFFLSG